jgi:hypothetical protein
VREAKFTAGNERIRVPLMRACLFRLPTANWMRAARRAIAFRYLRWWSTVILQSADEFFRDFSESVLVSFYNTDPMEPRWGGRGRQKLPATRGRRCSP